MVFFFFHIHDLKHRTVNKGWIIVPEIFWLRDTITMASSMLNPDKSIMKSLPLLFL